MFQLQRNEIIGEMEYILHFYNSPIISLGSAHKIAEVLNVDDKIEYIYLYLLKQNQKSKKFITEQQTS